MFERGIGIGTLMKIRISNGSFQFPSRVKRHNLFTKYKYISERINAKPHIDDECLSNVRLLPKFILVEYFKLLGEIKINKKTFIPRNRIDDDFCRFLLRAR